MATEPRERNPYIGPRPFERQDGDRFFGRDREVSEVLSLIIAHRMLLLYAQSGAGKTSLVNAGLSLLLEEEGFEILPLARMRGLIPEDIKPEEISNLYVFNTLVSWAGDEADPRRLAHVSLADFLRERERRTDEEGLPAPRVIVFDQFEELFTFYPERWRDRERFFEQVNETLEEDPLLRAIFVMREDHIAQLDPYVSLLPEKLRTRFRLERLGKAAALPAVTEPLRDTRCSFAEGVAEKLVNDLMKVQVETTAGKAEMVTGEFVEPVQLQVVCQSLWRGLPPDVTVITHDDLQAFGDVNQALSAFYEGAIERAAQKTSVDDGDLRTWFERSLITPSGTRGTVYRGREETGGIPNPAVDELQDLHLIRGEWRAGARWYELTHDRFIGPIQKSNEAWRAKRRERWLRIGGGVAVVIILLLVGLPALVAAIVTQTTQAAAVEVGTAAAVEAGTAAAVEAGTAVAVEVSEVKATAAAASSGLAASLLRGRLRPLKPGLSVSGIQAGSGTIGAFVRDAKGEFYLLSTADVLGSPDYALDSPVVQPGRGDGGQEPDDVVGYFTRYLPLADGVSVANMTGLARLEEGIVFETSIPGIGPIRGVRDPTRGMIVRMLGRTTGLATGEITEIGVATAISGLPQGTIRLSNGIETSPLSQPGDGGALVVDEEGYAIGIVVAGSETKTILAPIQDVLDSLGVRLVHIGQELLLLLGHKDLVLDAVWSPDGTRIATASQDDTARLWDARTGEELVVLKHGSDVNSVAFSPDGRLVVTASQDGTARVWDVITGEELAILQHGGGVISAAFSPAFSPDGRLLVTGSHDDTARVWEVTIEEKQDGEEPSVGEMAVKELAVLQHKGSVWSAVFSPDGQWVVTASWDDTARVWEATTGKQLAILRGHTGSVRSAVFSPDGQRVVTASQDGTARVWDAATGKEVAALRHDDSVWSAAFSPDGRLVVTASQDKTARVWDAVTGEELAVLRHEGEVLSAAFRPNGSYLVTASADGAARLWDTTSGELLFTLEGHTDEVLGAAWSPDGVRIVTAGGDGTARIWQGR
ncbi:MAG: hypothetical protein ISS49_02905 [Anaerolineae bacterium]|nr:hypothetical protein [Anaerolineae bacterium]